MTVCKTVTYELSLFDLFLAAESPDRPAVDKILFWIKRCLSFLTLKHFLVLKINQTESIKALSIIKNVFQIIHYEWPELKNGFDLNFYPL